MLSSQNAHEHIRSGQGYWKDGLVQEALHCFEQACQVDANNTEVWLTYASALIESNQDEKAQNAFQHVLTLTHNHPEAVYGLSLILERQKRPLEALEYIRKLLTEAPEHPLWLDAFGSLAFQAGLLNEAADAYRTLSQQSSPEDPTLPLDALTNLATIELALNDYDSAKTHFETVLKDQPDNIKAQLGLADTQLNLNQTEAALQAYQQVIQHHQIFLTRHERDAARVKQAMFLPIIYESLEEITHWRERLESALCDLEAHPPELINPVHSVGRTPFYLPYQGYPDKGYQERLASVLQQSLSDQLVLPPPEGANSNHKIRIGFISKYLQTAHTIGKVMWGVTHHLNREKFEIIHLHLGEGLSNPQNWPIRAQDRRLELPLWDTTSAAKQILECQLDILVYCDIGMEPSSYFLALNKLAPIQCVTWGHPITTGLNTMNAMISSRYFELPVSSSQSFYTEPLHLLETLPTWYRAPEKTQTVPPLSKNDFGFADHQTLYSCPQSLYKIHPAFDPLLQGILEEDDTGQIVFFEGFHPSIHHSLIKRWNRSIPNALLNRIHFLPRTNATHFYSFLRCTDVMLDPVHFGGGNTSLEALSFGTPIITLPSQLMRGRFTQGFYQQLGFCDWIANDERDYIHKACQLGKDPALRQDVRQAILSKNHGLYENPDVIEAWEKCLLSLVEKHRHAPLNM